MACEMASVQVEEEPELPEEISESLESFHEALGKIDDVFKPLLDTPVDDLKEKLEPLECAKLDLVMAYSINSLFWMYLITQGINPKEHPVKQELERIKKYMGKVKEASEKKEAAVRINKVAAKRFVKSALWEASDKKKKNTGEESNNQGNKEKKNTGEESNNQGKEKTPKKSDKRKTAEESPKPSEKKKKKSK